MKKKQRKQGVMASQEFENQGKELRKYMESSGFSFDQPNANLVLGSIINDLGLRDTNKKTAISWLTARRLFKQLYASRDNASRGQIINQIQEESDSVFSSEMSNYIYKFISDFCDISPTIARTENNITKENFDINNNLDASIEISPFYQMPTKVIFLLSFFTAGIYDLLWIYRHWKQFKIRANLTGNFFNERDEYISPFWCSVFWGWYIVGLGRRIKRHLIQTGKQATNVYIWLTFWICTSANSATSYLDIVRGNTKSDGGNIPSQIALFILAYLAINAINAFMLMRLQSFANEANNSNIQHIKTWTMRPWDYAFLAMGALVFISSALNLIDPV